jgi:hypothetical protein
MTFPNQKRLQVELLFSLFLGNSKIPLIMFSSHQERADSAKPEERKIQKFSLTKESEKKIELERHIIRV